VCVVVGGLGEGWLLRRERAGFQGKRGGVRVNGGVGVSGSPKHREKGALGRGEGGPGDTAVNVGVG